jgi:hypothetical protein
MWENAIDGMSQYQIGKVEGKLGTLLVNVPIKKM